MLNSEDIQLTFGPIFKKYGFKKLEFDKDQTDRFSYQNEKNSIFFSYDDREGTVNISISIRSLHKTWSLHLLSIYFQDKNIKGCSERLKDHKGLKNLERFSRENILYWLRYFSNFLSDCFPEILDGDTSWIENYNAYCISKYGKNVKP